MTEKKLAELLDTEEWKSFAQAARDRDFDPVYLIFDFMQGCIESWEGAELHEAMRADVQKFIAIHGDIDPVEFVRQIRREKKNRAVVKRKVGVLHATA